MRLLGILLPRDAPEGRVGPSIVSGLLCSLLLLLGPPLPPLTPPLAEATTAGEEASVMAIMLRLFKGERGG